MTEPSPRELPNHGVGWVGYGIIPTLVLLGVFDSRRLPTGGFGGWTTFFLAGLPTALVGAGFVIRAGGWSRTTRLARICAAAFLLLLAVAGVSGLVNTQYVHDRLTDLGTLVVPETHVVMPLLCALVACVLGWVFAHAPLESQLPNVVAALSWAILAVVVVALARMALRGELGGRLNSAFAGASSIHVALLLGFAGFIGLVRVGFARTPHLIGAAGTFLAMLLTGSRAGVLLAGLFVVVQLLSPWAGRRRIRIRLGLGLGALGVFTAAVLLIPDLSNRLTLVDEYRARNAATAVQAWVQSPTTFLLGNGQGTLWPWMAYEHGLVPVVQDWDLWTPWGPVLPSPHSTWLWALAELGLLGLSLLVVATVPPALRGITSRNDLAQCLGLGLLLSLVSFATDTHLVKVFPVAVVWWTCAFIVFRLPGRAPRES